MGEADSSGRPHNKSAEVIGWTLLGAGLIATPLG
jgi:hypothetical protein